MDQRKVLVQAYRSLYRTALRAVLYSSPARFQIRDTMRTAFSPDSREHFDPRRVKNTVEFLERAGSYSGMEHKILRNLVHVRYWQSTASKDTRMVRGNTKTEADIRRHSWAQYEATLEQLNQSLNLCLR